MKSLTQLLILNLQLLYLHLKYSYLIVSIIRDKLKILYTIIIFDMVLMMDYLPAMEIAAKGLCHYKAVFKDIAVFSHHLIKKVIGIKFYTDITLRRIVSATLPSRVFITLLRPMTISTMATFKGTRSIFTYFVCNPTFLPTTFTNVPNIFLVKIFSIYTYILSFPNISNLWHSITVPQLEKNVKVVI